MRRTKDSPAIDQSSITNDGSEITERVISGLLSNDQVYINESLEKDLEVLKKDFPEHFSAVEQWNKDNLARNDINHFAESVIFDENGNLIKQREMDRLIQSHIDDCEKTGHYCGILAPVGAGKAIDINTPIPTIDGFKLIKDISIGDTVFDRKGNPCSVTAVSEIQFNRNVYELTFSDRSKAIADEDHRWLVWTADDLRERYTSSKINRVSDNLRIVTTGDIARKGLARNRKTGRDSKWRIPIGGAVRYKHKNLPIDPYVLGVWLGDGTQRTSEITYDIRDKEIAERCVRIEGGCKPRSDKRNTNVMTCCIGPAKNTHDKNSLRSRLRNLGLIQKHNSEVKGTKFIPSEYLTGSIEQRFDLLAGLLDTDGSVDGLKIEFSSKYERLANEVVELIRSLGIRCGSPREGKTKAADRYRVTFTAYTPVFKLRRKRQKQENAINDCKINSKGMHAKSITIHEIKKIDSIPVRCITVDSPDSSYRIGRSYLVTHNTVQTAVIRPLFKIWKNKNILIKIISASEDLAMKRCEHVGRIIMNNKNFQRICGDEIRPAPARHKSEESWSKARFVVDRSSGSIDGTVESYGMLSTGMGGRCHLIIFDDCIDDRSTIISPALKASVKQKFEAQWMTRPFQNAGFAIWICTRWTEDDLSSDLMNNQVWKFLEIAVSEDFEKLTYKKMHKRIVYEEGEIPLPYPFTKESLLKSYDLIGPLQFNRTFRQRPYSDSDKLFGSAEVCFRNDVSFAQSAEIVLKNKFPTYIGVDLAGTKRKGTAIVTVGLDNNKKRWLASATIGRWKAPDLLLRLASLDQKFNPRFIVVETNSYQESLIDWARNSPEKYPFYHKLVSFTTTAQAKQDEKFGLRSMDIEFQNNAWVIPANTDGHPDVAEHVKGCGECLIRDEIIGYPIYPTSDLVMAMWFARSVIVDNQFTNAELDNRILENLPEDEFFDRMDKMDQYGFYRPER